MDASHASLVRARNPCYLLVCFFGAAVKCNLDGEGTPLDQVICYFRGDERPVCKKGNEQSLLLRIDVDVKKVLSGKYLTARVQEPQTTRLCNLIEDTAVLLIGQLAAFGFLVAQGKIVVTVNALVGTSPGHLDGATDGNPLVHHPLMEPKAPFHISLDFHALILFLLIIFRGVDQTGFLQGTDQIHNVFLRLFRCDVVFAAHGINDLADAGLSIQKLPDK